MNLVLIGAPGSGKGTQGKIIAKALGLIMISTGEILRNEVELGSEIGNFAKSYMMKGELVPDNVIVEIVKNRIMKDDCQNGFILDGFPRNITQALTLGKTLHQINKELNLVLSFEIDEESLVKRILGRFTCTNCGAIYNLYFKKPLKEGVCDLCNSTSFSNRSDDNEVVIKNRLKIYNQTSFDLIEYYKKNNLLVSIDASLEPSDLSKNISKILKSFSNSKNN